MCPGARAKHITNQIKMSQITTFDFDSQTNFKEKGIGIDAGFSTGSTNSTYIYGRNTSRVKSDDFNGYNLSEGSFQFSDKSKLILSEGEMVLVKNDDGSIYLIDYIDSYRNIEGEDDFNGVKLQHRLLSQTTFQPELKPKYDSDDSSMPGTLFDFDYHTEFKDLEINIEAGMSTGGSDATWIYGDTARIKSDNYQEFSYDQNSHDFSTKAKLILEDGEMALIKNPNGDVYLIDWIDSLRNYEDGLDGVRLRYRNVHTAEMPTTAPVPTPTPELTPTPIPTPAPIPTPEPEPISPSNNNTTINNIDNSITIINNIDNSINTEDNSINVNIESLTNIYNAFTMEKVPVDLSEIITGSGKSAELVGGSIKDDIIGFGRGKYRLFGDRGEDLFVFNKKDKFGAKGADRIIDFNPAKDQLLVGKKALKGIGNKPKFATASNRKEKNTLMREDMELVYFEPKGQLYYNQNEGGKGFGKKGGLFAILEGAPEITQDSVGLLA